MTFVYLKFIEIQHLLRDQYVQHKKFIKKKI